MTRVEFQLHDDGVVSFDGKNVGALVKGEDGMAYVKFLAEFTPQTGELWFCGPNPPFYA